jgi:DNA-binding NtrC family response regulator
MAKQPAYKILIVDDERSIASGLSELLRMEGYETTEKYDGKAALQLLEKQEFNLVLVDLMMPGLTGLQLLEEIKQRGWSTEVIIITGQGTISTAVDAMKAGAYDYLTKPVQPARLRTIVPKALERQNLILTNRRLEQTIKNMSRYDDMVGNSEKIQQVYGMIDAVADTTANVLITGESGTGKELVARAIHKKSSRVNKPFLALNCSAFPRDILENELFGHERGAFTGALNEKPGCFEMANNGTLFLDEIGEMPADTQAKLLRVLEEKRFRRLGGTKEITVDVRVIAATNRKIKEAIAEGRLREDLYYRLNVMEISLPPLRERMSDVQSLLFEFLKIYNQRNNKTIKDFDPQAIEKLMAYSWPGNIRELKNSVERAVILCNEEYIQVKHLPTPIVQREPQTGKPESIGLGKPLHEIERDIIFRTLELTNNNKTKAAEMLGISLKTMHNKLNKYYANDAADHD